MSEQLDSSVSWSLTKAIQDVVASSNTDCDTPFALLKQACVGPGNGILFLPIACSILLEP